jgi:curved DNA-binding protein
MPRDEKRSEKRDLYQTLGVARDADPDVLRKAYRKLARRHHPDLNPDDAQAEEEFKRISEAYAVLSDPEKRRNYDEFGEISLEGGFDAEKARRSREAFEARFGSAPFGRGFRTAGGFDAPGGEAFEFGHLDDLLGDLFARRGGARHPARGRGADLEAVLTLDFLDAARGGEHRITVNRPGADGRVTPETLTVRIPAGVADGGRIRLAGKGARGTPGAPPGDLYAVIRTRPHPVFRREGRDIYVQTPVTVREAILGATIEVPTLEGRARVTVPPETDSGRTLRLRGKGIADPNSGARGDLFIVLEIRVPRDLDDDAKRAVESLASFEPSDLRKDLFR